VSRSSPALAGGVGGGNTSTGIARDPVAAGVIAPRLTDSNAVITASAAPAPLPPRPPLMQQMPAVDVSESASVMVLDALPTALPGPAVAVAAGTATSANAPASVAAHQAEDATRPALPSTSPPSVPPSSQPLLASACPDEGMDIVTAEVGGAAGGKLQGTSTPTPPSDADAGLAAELGPATSMEVSCPALPTLPMPTVRAESSVCTAPERTSAVPQQALPPDSSLPAIHVAPDVNAMPYVTPARAAADVVASPGTLTSEEGAGTLPCPVITALLRAPTRPPALPRTEANPMGLQQPPPNAAPTMPLPGGSPPSLLPCSQRLPAPAMPGSPLPLLGSFNGRPPPPPSTPPRPPLPPRAQSPAPPPPPSMQPATVAPTTPRSQPLARGATPTATLLSSMLTPPAAPATCRPSPEVATSFLWAAAQRQHVTPLAVVPPPLPLPPLCGTAAASGQSPDQGRSVVASAVAPVLTSLVTAPPGQPILPARLRRGGLPTCACRALLARLSACAALNAASAITASQQQRAVPLLSCAAPPPDSTPQPSPAGGAQEAPGIAVAAGAPVEGWPWAGSASCMRLRPVARATPFQFATDLPLLRGGTIGNEAAGAAGHQGRVLSLSFNDVPLCAARTPLERPAGPESPALPEPLMFAACTAAALSLFWLLPQPPPVPAACVNNAIVQLALVPAGCVVACPHTAAGCARGVIARGDTGASDAAAVDDSCGEGSSDGEDEGDGSEGGGPCVEWGEAHFVAPTLLLAVLRIHSKRSRRSQQPVQPRGPMAAAYRACYIPGAATGSACSATGACGGYGGSDLDLSASLDSTTAELSAAASTAAGPAGEIAFDPTSSQMVMTMLVCPAAPSSGAVTVGPGVTVTGGVSRGQLEAGAAGNGADRACDSTKEVGSGQDHSSSLVAGAPLSPPGSEALPVASSAMAASSFAPTQLVASGGTSSTSIAGLLARMRSGGNCVTRRGRMFTGWSWVGLCFLQEARQCLR